MKLTFKHLVFSFVVAGLAGQAVAQQAPASEAKRQLARQVLSLWHVEDQSISLVQMKAVESMQSARIALQGRVTEGKHAETMKSMQVDAQKYIDEATPIVTNAAQRLKEPVVMPMLLDTFSEDELKQLIVLLQSPLKKKFEDLVPKAQKAFGTKVAEETRPQIQPKIEALTQGIGVKLRAAVMPAQ